MMSNTEPTKKPGVNSCAHEGYSVPASYKTPAVLIINTVKKFFPKHNLLTFTHIPKHNILTLTHISNTLTLFCILVHHKIQVLQVFFHLQPKTS